MLCVVSGINSLDHTVGRVDLCLFAVRGLRPDFLFFLLNILFFKGEEKADPLQLPVCICLVPD